jgi:hypothetical protein
MECTENYCAHKLVFRGEAERNSALIATILLDQSVPEEMEKMRERIRDKKQKNREEES